MIPSIVKAIFALSFIQAHVKANCDQTTDPVLNVCSTGNVTGTTVRLSGMAAQNIPDIKSCECVATASTNAHFHVEVTPPGVTSCGSLLIIQETTRVVCSGGDFVYPSVSSVEITLKRTLTPFYSNYCLSISTETNDVIILKCGEGVETTTPSTTTTTPQPTTTTTTTPTTTTPTTTMKGMSTTSTSKPTTTTTMLRTTTVTSTAEPTTTSVTTTSTTSTTATPTPAASSTNIGTSGQTVTSTPSVTPTVNIVTSARVTTTTAPPPSTIQISTTSIQSTTTSIISTTKSTSEPVSTNTGPISTTMTSATSSTSVSRLTRKDGDDDVDVNTVVAASVGGGVGLLLICGIIIMCCLIRRKQAQENGRKERAANMERNLQAYDSLRNSGNFILQKRDVEHEEIAVVNAGYEPSESTQPADTSQLNLQNMSAKSSLSTRSKKSSSDETGYAGDSNGETDTSPRDKPHVNVITDDGVYAVSLKGKDSQQPSYRKWHYEAKDKHNEVAYVTKVNVSKSVRPEDSIEYTQSLKADALLHL